MKSNTVDTSLHRCPCFANLFGFELTAPRAISQSFCEKGAFWYSLAEIACRNNNVSEIPRKEKREINFR